MTRNFAQGRARYLPVDTINGWSPGFEKDEISKLEGVKRGI